MKLIGGTLAAAAVLMLAGCGGSEGSPSATPEETPEETPSSLSAAPVETVAPETESAAPETSPAPIVVSVASTCELLFNSGTQPLLTRVVKFVNDPTLETSDRRRVTNLIDDMDGAAVRARPIIRPYIDAQTVVLRAYKQDLVSGQGESHDLQDFRAAGYELINQCKSFIG